MGYSKFRGLHYDFLKLNDQLKQILRSVRFGSWAPSTSESRCGSWTNILRKRFQLRGENMKLSHIYMDIGSLETFVNGYISSARRAIDTL